jgi:transposase-like protein
MPVFRSRQEWFSLIAAWEKSGLSRSAFCKSYQLSPASFYKWQKRYRESCLDVKASRSLPALPQFIELDTLQAQSEPIAESVKMFRIKTSYGWVLELPL